MLVFVVCWFFNHDILLTDRDDNDFFNSRVSSSKVYVLCVIFSLLRFCSPVVPLYTYERLQFWYYFIAEMLVENICQIIFFKLDIYTFLDWKEDNFPSFKQV